MNKNMNLWLNELIAADKKSGFLLLSFPAISKMNITIEDLLHSSELQAKVIKTVSDATPDDIADIGLIDLSVEAEAFGCSFQYSDDKLPSIVGSIIKSYEDAQALKVPSVHLHRTQIHLDALKKYMDMNITRPVFACVIGPFSLAARLMGISETMFHLCDEPKMVHLVLEKTTAFLMKYMEEYKKAGVHGILITEPVAGIVAPEQQEEFSGSYIRKIVTALQTNHFLIGYHNCGDSTRWQIDDLITNGCRFFHFGNSVSISDMLPHVPEDILVMGNLDPVSQFLDGTPDSIKQATYTLLDSCSTHPNFIPSSGCDLPPLSSWDNIQAFYEAVRNYYK